MGSSKISSRNGFEVEVARTEQYPSATLGRSAMSGVTTVLSDVVTEYTQYAAPFLVARVESLEK